MTGKRLSLISIILVIFTVLSSCASNNVDVFTDDETKVPDAYITPDEGSDGEGDSLGVIEEAQTDEGQGSEIDNPFIDASKNPISIVSATAETASYKHFRDLVNSGYSLNELKKCSYSFKNEEFLNYFASVSTSDEDFSSDVKIYPCSWNKDNYLLKFTFAAPMGEYSEKNNFVFYIDVSESMGSENMLPAIKGAAKSLADAVSDDDVVSIVTSASEDNVRLDSKNGADKDSIISAMESLATQGTANSHDALGIAYEIAKSNFIDGGKNTVVIISDGDISEKYSSMIEENLKIGVCTSVIALGSGNYKNQRLEEFSRSGNGQYYYVDGQGEAERVLGEKIFYAHKEIATDLSVKVDFDNALVEKYRLIGYEGKMQITDIDGDKEISSLSTGENITVCYEITLFDTFIETEGAFADITVKYDIPGNDNDVCESFIADKNSICEDDGEMQLISCAIETLMVLRSSAYGKNIKLTDVYNKLLTIDFNEHPKAEELCHLVGIITGKVKK